MSTWQLLRVLLVAKHLGDISSRSKAFDVGRSMVCLPTLDLKVLEVKKLTSLTGEADDETQGGSTQPESVITVRSSPGKMTQTPNKPEMKTPIYQTEYLIPKREAWTSVPGLSALSSLVNYPSDQIPPDQSSRVSDQRHTPRQGVFYPTSTPEDTLPELECRSDLEQDISEEPPIDRPLRSDGSSALIPQAQQNEAPITNLQNTSDSQLLQLIDHHDPIVINQVASCFTESSSSSDTLQLVDSDECGDRILRIMRLAYIPDPRSPSKRSNEEGLDSSPRTDSDGAEAVTVSQFQSAEGSSDDLEGLSDSELLQLIHNVDQRLTNRVRACVTMFYSLPETSGPSLFEVCDRTTVRIMKLALKAHAGPESGRTSNEATNQEATDGEDDK